MSKFKGLLIVSAIVLAQQAWAQGRAAAVGVQVVEQQLLSETVPVFAEVVTARNGAVAGRIAGNVERVNVLAGDRVDEGDVLVELNRELLTIRVNQSRAQIAEAEAAAATAQAGLDRTQTIFDRIEALRGTATISQGRFDEVQADLLEARSQLAEAEARKASAQAQLAESQYQLDRSLIKASFSGVVLEVTTIPGAYIQAGTSVVRLLDTSAFEVQANVPARYVDDLRPGMEVTARTDADTPVNLVLRAVLPVEERSTRTRAVRFTTADPEDDTLVAVGQSLTVSVPVGAARELLSVPKDALVQARGGWTVFVAAENKAQPRNVTIGVPLGDRYEVIDGLQEGDQVVVRGNERLRPGQDIAPTLIEASE